MSAAIICGALIQLAAIHQAAGMHGYTPGAGVECQRGEIVAAAGGYRNSQGGRSAYAAAGVLPLQIGPVRIGAVVGAVNGYRYRSGGVMPMAAGVVSVDLGAASVQVFAVPAVPGVSHAALQVGVFVPVGGL